MLARSALPPRAYTRASCSSIPGTASGSVTRSRARSRRTAADDSAPRSAARVAAVTRCLAAWSGRPESSASSAATSGHPAVRSGCARCTASSARSATCWRSDGSINVNFPSAASISAVCEPGSCNPAPIDQIGFYGAGTPIVSNTIQINAPGRDSDQIWFGSTQSQYVSEIDLTQGTKGTTVRLPYVPNSMVANASVTQLYFGSYRELMVYDTGSNSLSMDDRMTIASMAIEAGGKNGIFEFDSRTAEYV